MSNKLRIQLKDPDGVYEAIGDYVADSIPDLDADEYEALVEIRTEKIEKLVGKWFEFGEYLTVMIDLDNETIEVESVR